MKIIKRSGAEDLFDLKKIEAAIRKANDSVIDYVSDMNCSIRIMDGLWRRYMREQGDASILDVLNDSMRKCIGSLRNQCEMSVLVRDSCKCSGKYLQNHEYVMKKLDDFIKSFPDDARRLKRT